MRYEGPIIPAAPPLDGHDLPILVVGNLTAWKAAGGAMPRGEGIVFSDFSGLEAALTAPARPRTVLSAIASAEFDALLLAERLAALSFGGRYVVLAPVLPDPGLVEREIRAAAPGLDVYLAIRDS